MTITQELIERVERASGADLVIDLEIEWAVGDWVNLGGGWRQHKATGAREEFTFSYPRAYTASTDAAMSLAGDHFGSLVRGRFVGGRIAYVAVVTAPTRAEGQASTPALAITAASLRARMVQQ